MSRSRPFRPPRRRLIVDQGRIEDIPRSRAIYQQILKYQWDWYSEISFRVIRV